MQPNSEARTNQATGAASLEQQLESYPLSFPAGFLWGVSTSHFQVEGNPEEISGRRSDWSTWTSLDGKILDQSTADTACDFFSRYEADIELCQSLNLNTFRLSLNWAALLPRPEDKTLSEQSARFYKELL